MPSLPGQAKSAADGWIVRSPPGARVRPTYPLPRIFRIASRGLFMDAPESFLPRFHELASSLTTASESRIPDVDTARIISLVEFLDSVSDRAMVEEDEVWRQCALEIIEATYELLIGLTQEALDALSMNVPKAIAKFTGVSEKCGEIVDRIIDHICEVCNPREMLPFFCEALIFLKDHADPKMCLPLFRGISHAFLAVRRRHFEQIKVAVPVILRTLESASTVSVETDGFLDPLFERGIVIAFSMRKVSSRLVGRDKQQLTALLAVYILQVMAIVSKTVVSHAASSKLTCVYQLSGFLPFCGFSYLNLITGDNVEKVHGAILGDDDDHLLSCHSSIKHGASLAVLWSYISDEAAKHAGEDPSKVLHALQSDRSKRYKALCLLKHLLSSGRYSWDLKGYCIDFILSIMDDTIPQVSDDLVCEGFTSVTDLFGTMQAIELVIVYSSDANTRKKAFSALKSVLSDLPPPQNIDMLHALIAKCSYPSMIALLLDFAKEQFVDSYKRVIQTGKDTQIKERTVQVIPHGSSATLDLIEIVLKPPRGGPPSLPEESDAVVSALNFYRFLIILESSGKTNYSGVLLRSHLQKAYSEWLLPLRTLVSGVQTENRKDSSEIALDIDTSLNLVQLPLYHCIELVEHNLRKSKPL